MKIKLTTEEFIKRAKLIHGDKFDYSLVNYTNFANKVIIRCKIHGEFTQAPKKHLVKQGCPKCNGKNKTTEELIEQFKVIHGSKYNYDKVIYKNNKSKIKIICPTHGLFYQVPSSHLQGCGCDKCGGTVNMDTKSFTSKAKLKHGDKYNYNKVDYIGCFDKVIITCKIHGDFTQKPASHLRYGCIKCGGKEKFNNEIFAEKSKSIHKDKFIYDKVDYINNDTKVIITCKTHGDFTQSPKNHLNGFGCYLCNNSNSETLIEDILIENEISYKPQYTFPDLRHKSILYFDFGILDKNGNLKYIIEYNGEQHYIFNKFMHLTQEGFETHKLRDKIKEDYCEKNNIPLYIIRYDEDLKISLDKIIKPDN